MDKKYIRPFLKWAGNKYKVLPRILAHLPTSTRLIEPFMGSGSLMLNRPTKFYLGGDINADLISVFNLLKQDQKTFFEHLQPLFTQERFDIAGTEKHVRAGEASFYAAREEFNTAEAGMRKAALFVFLNQHCFNGLCRYNQYGKFTTPYNLGFANRGRPAELVQERFLRAAEMCKDAEFVSTSFELTMARATSGDVVYCDPPYLPQDHKASTFTQYAEGDFQLMQQQELAELADVLRTLGVTTVISNHNCERARELYSTADVIQTLDVQRSMGRYEGHENSASELLAIFKAR